MAPARQTSEHWHLSITSTSQRVLASKPLAAGWVLLRTSTSPPTREHGVLARIFSYSCLATQFLHKETIHLLHTANLQQLLWVRPYTHLYSLFNLGRVHLTHLWYSAHRVWLLPSHLWLAKNDSLRQNGLTLFCTHWVTIGWLPFLRNDATPFQKHPLGWIYINCCFKAHLKSGII